MKAPNGFRKLGSAPKGFRKLPKNVVELPVEKTHVLKIDQDNLDIIQAALGKVGGVDDIIRVVIESMKALVDAQEKQAVAIQSALDNHGVLLGRLADEIGSLAGRQKGTETAIKSINTVAKNIVPLLSALQTKPDSVPRVHNIKRDDMHLIKQIISTPAE